MSFIVTAVKPANIREINLGIDKALTRDREKKTSMSSLISFMKIPELVFQNNAVKIVENIAKHYRLSKYHVLIDCDEYNREFETTVLLKLISFRDTTKGGVLTVKNISSEFVLTTNQRIFDGNAIIYLKYSLSSNIPTEYMTSHSEKKNIIDEMTRMGSKMIIASPLKVKLPNAYASVTKKVYIRLLPDNDLEHLPILVMDKNMLTMSSSTEINPYNLEDKNFYKFFANVTDDKEYLISSTNPNIIDFITYLANDVSIFYARWQPLSSLPLKNAARIVNPRDFADPTRIAEEKDIHRAFLGSELGINTGAANLLYLKFIIAYENDQSIPGKIEAVINRTTIFISERDDHTVYFSDHLSNPEHGVLMRDKSLDIYRLDPNRDTDLAKSFSIINVINVDDLDANFPNLNFRFGMMSTNGVHTYYRAMIISIFDSEKVGNPTISYPCYGAFLPIGSRIVTFEGTGMDFDSVLEKYVQKDKNNSSITINVTKNKGRQYVDNYAYTMECAFRTNAKITKLKTTTIVPEKTGDIIGTYMF